MRTVYATKSCSTGRIDTRRAVGNCAGHGRIVRMGLIYNSTPHDNSCHDTIRLVKQKK